MKSKKIFPRFISVLIALVTFVNLFPALPSLAIDIEDIPPADFVWELDFSKMNDLYDTMGNTSYTLEGKNVTLAESQGKKALSIINKNGLYTINDVENLLDDYNTFYIEADMFFESYPSGTNGGKTSMEYPMSFVSWVTRNNGAESNKYLSIRVDGEGYLCTGTDPINKPTQKSEAKLPLGEWFNIRFAISPLTGYCEVYINGQNLLTYKAGAPNDMIKSSIRFFDTRYKYSVHFSNISIYTKSNYRIGLVKEEAADYIAYQTSPIENGKFDLRVLSAINLDNITEYNRTGFVVTTLWEEKGEAKSSEQNLSTTTVYESVVANGKTVTASELGAKYLAPITIEGLDSTKSQIEIVLRPYVKKDGISTYGDAIILKWAGEIKDGYPVLSPLSSSVAYTAKPSGDTYVRHGLDENYYAETSLNLKNGGPASNTTRDVYIKFNFSEAAIKRLLASGRIYLEYYVISHRGLTADEEAEGGILADVCGVTTEWDEDELTGTNADSLAKETEWIGDMRYKSKQFNRIDVTDYVLRNVSSGEVAFKISNVENDGSGGETRISAGSNSANAPRLTIYPILYNHEINLGKLKNNGYEPWGYAEQLVNEWFKTGYASVFTGTYETINLNAVNNTKPTGDYTIRSDWKISSPDNKWSANVYARSLDTLTGFTPSAVSEYDEYGGITNSGIKGKATGYFHTETINGRTYIIDPVGNPFFATAINSANIGSTENQKQASLAKYGTAENFYKEVTDTLRSLGVNMYWGGDDEFLAQNKLAKAVGLGCISGYMGNSDVGLGLSVSTGGSAAFMHNNTMNVFDPDFVSFCNTKVANTIAPYLGNKYILGFYSDNEIPAETNMLYRYLTIDPSEPVNAFSYATAWTWLIKATGNPNASTADITPKLAEEFKAFVYDRYYTVVTNAIDAAGGGDYMYLGNRIHGENYKSEGYLSAASKHVDVLTVNLYGGLEPPIETIKTMYKYSGKPFLVTEFFAKAEDAVDMNGYSMGNQSNAGWIVKTQQDRAIHYENYVLLLLESGTCVGWSWYRMRDNDQTIYRDEVGNLYRAYDYKNGGINKFYNLKTGDLIDGPGLLPSLTIYYKGETDTSNLGSNKGIFDNKMNIYPELTGAMKRISDNLFDIINYFDALHK